MAKTKKKPKRKEKKAKKAAAKAAKKKPAKPKTKRQVYVKVKTKLLGEAPQEYEFYLSDGRRLGSVFELVDALETMSDEIFREHVTEAKNDFSSWIKDVFEEPKVADEIKKIQDRIETQKVLLKKLIEAAKKVSR